MREAGISRAGAPQARPHDDPVPGVRVADDLVERHFRPGRAERAVDRRRHLPQDLGGLAVPGRRPGRLLAARIVGWCDGRSHALRACRRRARRWPSAAGARRPADPPLRPGHRNTSRWPSARPLATPASPARWAPRATATTTPSPRASSPRSRRSSSTAAPGRPAASSPPRSSSTSRPSTTERPPPLHARLPLARRLREQNSHRPRCQSRRFAAPPIAEPSPRAIAPGSSSSVCVRICA